MPDDTNNGDIKLKGQNLNLNSNSIAAKDSRIGGFPQKWYQTAFGGFIQSDAVQIQNHYRIL